MANKVELIIKNNLGVATSVDILDFPYRLNRKSFTTSDDKLKVLGGSFSTSIRLAKSKRNNLIFAGKSEINSLGKFNALSNYEATLYENGAQIMTGTLTLEEITATYYEGTFYDQDINWVDKLSNIRLNQLGYVDGLPTWLVPFDGAASFNVVNEQTNRQTDYICPTIIYNNTPITDYLGFTDDDIWGTFELPLAPTPVRLTSGLTFPDDFVTQTGFFGDRLGLTFEDFPPAIYYRNLIEKCFDEVGLSVDCSLFDQDWFNRLYLPYVGDGYQYNWANLATIRSQVLSKTINGLDVLLPPSQDNGLTMFDDVYSTTNYDEPVLPVLPGNPITHTNWVEDVELFFKCTQTFGSQDYSSPYYIDKITAINPFNIPNYYIVPADGRFNIHIGTGVVSSYDDFVTKFSPSNTRYDGKVLFQSYANKDLNSIDSLPQIDKHYGYDDNVFVILRQRPDGSFAYTETMEMLMQWMAGQNQDFLNNPSDVIAYISPKRWVKYDSGIITNEREAFGSPITDWQNDVTVYEGSYPPSHVITTPGTALNSESYADIEITLDLYKNERISGFWINLGNIQCINNSLTQGQFFEKYALETTYCSIGEGAAQPDLEEHFHIITYECGEYDLDLAKNLPSISAKDFISSFIKQFNLHFIVNGNTVQFIPQNTYYTPETYDITARVVDESWVANPVDSAKSWEVGYNNDDNDRLLNEDDNVCDGVNIVGSDYGNVQVDNDNIYSDKELNSYNTFSATKFYQGNVVSIDYSDVLTTISIPTTTDPESGFVLDKGFQYTYTIPHPGSLNYYLDFPSIQSQSSFAQDTVGVLEYNWNYSPRILYHLGTTNTYLGISNDYQCLIDSPRSRDGDNFPDTTFIRLPKHWYKPTISAFDTENNNPYRTLRYDTANGLFNTYFENIIDIYNQSEIISVQMSMRNIDWLNMTGAKKIKYKDMLYRLMSISDYDPLTNRPCKVTLLKEI